MSLAVRNKRLYETLKGMGLFVTAIPRTDFPNEIDYIAVSCQAPGGPRVLYPLDRSGEVPVHVGSPLQGPEVGEGIPAAVRDGDNVIDLPPKV